MFSKSISSKHTQEFINGFNPKHKFSINIEIKSNHQMDDNTLILLENQIKNISVINYHLESEKKKLK